MSTIHKYSYISSIEKQRNTIHTFTVDPIYFFTEVDLYKRSQRLYYNIQWIVTSGPILHPKIQKLKTHLFGITEILSSSGNWENKYIIIK